MSYERIITSSEVFGVMDELMADKPEGFGYKDVYKAVKGQDWGPFGTCQNWTADPEQFAAQGKPSDAEYTGDRIPMCIIGQWLDKSGLLYRVDRYNSWLTVVELLAGDGVGFTDEAMRAMHMMQSMQDQGVDWKTSIMAARFAARSVGNVEHAKEEANYGESYLDKDFDPNCLSEPGEAAPL